MNTPAHVVLSAVLLGRGRGRAHWLAATLGAIAPDLPMLCFYLYQRIGLGNPEQLIWSTLYYDAAWQRFFDAFNGFPVIALGLSIAYARRSQATIVFFLSMAIHSATDLLVHREDGHGHLFPISDWRFISPVSYWDPAHYGHLFSALEGAGVLVGTILLFRKGGAWRYVGLTCGVVHLGFAFFAFRTWVRLF